VAASLAFMNPLPLLVGLGLEALYLLFVPDSKWYQARLARKYDREVDRRRHDLRVSTFPKVSEEMRTRFLRLESLRSALDARDHEAKDSYRRVLRKLDYLLEKFLMFAAKRGEYEAYVLQVHAEATPTELPPPFTTPRTMSDQEIAKKVRQADEVYGQEIEQVIAEVSSEQNLHSQAILQKRLDVLTRRRQYFSQIGDALGNVAHQLDLIEDTFGLINDELRARSPEQILVDIDEVVSRSDSLASHLQSFAPFDPATLAEGADKLYNTN